MVTHTGFQPWTVRRRFGAFLPVFASLFFCFLCSLRADIIYMDENGKIISSEKTEIDKDGNIIVVPTEEAAEEIVTPADVENAEIKNADGEHLDLNYAGITVVSTGNASEVMFHRAPSKAVRVVIPDGVTEIDSGAFIQCRDLESVVFPNSVSFIPPDAFSYERNQKLKSVVIPAHVSIGARAFHSLQSLESVTLNRDGEAAAPPVSEDAAIGDEAFSWCMKLKQIEFPEGIRSIGKLAFINCDMESVELPDGVETIGEQAFCQCAAMKTLHLPDSVKTIGDNAFMNCS